MPYHLFAVAPLVYLAEFGEDNYMNLYADHNYAMKKLDGAFNAGFGRYQLFCEGCWLCSGHAQWASDGRRNQLGKDLCGALARSVISRLLAQAASLSYMYLDGLPPG